MIIAMSKDEYLVFETMIEAGLNEAVSILQMYQTTDVEIVELEDSDEAEEIKETESEGTEENKVSEGVEV